MKYPKSWMRSMRAVFRKAEVMAKLKQVKSDMARLEAVTEYNRILSDAIETRNSLEAHIKIVARLKSDFMTKEVRLNELADIAGLTTNYGVKL